MSADGTHLASEPLPGPGDLGLAEHVAMWEERSNEDTLATATTRTRTSTRMGVGCRLRHMLSFREGTVAAVLEAGRVRVHWDRGGSSDHSAETWLELRPTQPEVGNRRESPGAG